MSQPAGVVTVTGSRFVCVCGDAGTEWFSSNPYVGPVWLHASDNPPRCLTAAEAEAKIGRR
jgi:hypothetical protein